MPRRLVGGVADLVFFGLVPVVFGLVVDVGFVVFFGFVALVAFDDAGAVGPFFFVRGGGDAGGAGTGPVDQPSAINPAGFSTSGRCTPSSPERTKSCATKPCGLMLPNTPAR